MQEAAMSASQLRHRARLSVAIIGAAAEVSMAETFLELFSLNQELQHLDLHFIGPEVPADLHGCTVDLGFPEGNAANETRRCPLHQCKPCTWQLKSLPSDASTMKQKKSIINHASSLCNQIGMRYSYYFALISKFWGY
jgi:hypothetical protein